MDKSELEALIRKAAEKTVRSHMPAAFEVPENAPGSSQKRMLVIWPDTPGSAARHIAAGYPDCRLTVASYGAENLPGVGPALDLNDGETRRKIKREADSFDCLVCVCPGLKQMESVASADDTGFAEGLILYFLLHKKEARILVDYDLGALPATALTRKVNELLQSLTQIGVAIDTLKCETRQENAGSVFEKELISESLIDELAGAGSKEIRCRGCIVTPLARDRAGERGIRIITE